MDTIKKYLFVLFHVYFDDEANFVAEDRSTIDKTV